MILACTLAAMYLSLGLLVSMAIVRMVRRQHVIASHECLTFCAACAILWPWVLVTSLLHVWALQRIRHGP